MMVGILPIESGLIDGSCYFQFLFRPHPTIVERADEHLTRLYGSPSLDYVAWHWHHGDVDNRVEEPVLMSKLYDIMTCAIQLGTRGGVDVKQRPLMLITDFKVFRRMVFRGEFTHLVTPDFTPHEIEDDYMDSIVLDNDNGTDGYDNGNDGYDNGNVGRSTASSQLVLPLVLPPRDVPPPASSIFVDLLLLARARCLLISTNPSGTNPSGSNPSGSSHIAIWMGGKRLLECHESP
ncbi:hypothetical protein PLESTF_000514000 [Pleodorina starrii]|nr:hypothetical protein PLESTF_000514000 [Pleodorina starrii]